ncbi:DUF6686 family protein [Winogradskyella sp.]|jgi:hypothetical protein|uniref:DUF6686 family protein n=1 Tax=Winogradskyella sp. TaxID=1883156 RepID=UPI0025D0C424|nr:DUF6686 family protein [Winogradskyella sp.]MCT4628622.1 hypothetical protein [Winogradskyella sp.]
MCKRIKILSRVKSGELSYCKNCGSFHLVFNNLFFALDRKELKRFKSYIDDLEIEYWENKYDSSELRRKIPLPTTQDNLVIMFNRQEIVELKTMLNFSMNSNAEIMPIINVDDIDYKLQAN